MSFITDFESWGQKAKVVPGIIRFGLIGVALGLTAYYIITFTGPFRYLSYWQAEFMDGEYYVLFSGLITVLIFLLPAAIIVRLLVPYYAKKKGVKEIPEVISLKPKRDNEKTDEIVDDII